jgi:hypothetical protein
MKFVLRWPQQVVNHEELALFTGADAFRNNRGMGCGAR